jgi:hypothetical protein
MKPKADAKPERNLLMLHMFLVRQLHLTKFWAIEFEITREIAQQESLVQNAVACPPTVVWRAYVRRVAIRSRSIRLVSYSLVHYHRDPELSALDDRQYAIRVLRDLEELMAEDEETDKRENSEACTKNAVLHAPRESAMMYWELKKYARTDMESSAASDRAYDDAASHTLGRPHGDWKVLHGDSGPEGGPAPISDEEQSRLWIDSVSRHRSRSLARRDAEARARAVQRAGARQEESDQRNKGPVCPGSHQVGADAQPTVPAGGELRDSDHGSDDGRAAGADMGHRDLRRESSAEGSQRFLEEISEGLWEDGWDCDFETGVRAGAEDKTQNLFDWDPDAE